MARFELMYSLKIFTAVTQVALCPTAFELRAHLSSDWKTRNRAPFFPTGSQSKSRGKNKHKHAPQLPVAQAPLERAAACVPARPRLSARLLKLAIELAAQVVRAARRLMLGRKQRDT